MNQKKFMDIKRLDARCVSGFLPGDHIVVQEKIDGANFSIRYDTKTDTIASFSRDKPLTFENTLRGAWNWVQKLYKEKVKETLGTNLVLFGEWLVQHKIVYPQDKYNNAYFYDVYDIERESYLIQSEVEKIVNKLGLIYVPVFYDGEFISWEHLKQFLGKTGLGGEQGEGIVVKNMTRINDVNSRSPFYTKIVTKEFAEKRRVRQVDQSKIDERLRLQNIAATIITEARVSKILFKMVDEDIIPEDWDETHMATIAKNIGRRVYYDCVKEEQDVVEQVGELFGKFANSISMGIVRKLLNERGLI